MPLASRICALLALASAGCSAQSYVAMMPGVLNAPGNRTLRREILEFGSGSLCRELLARSLPLRFNPDDPALGRFFPRECKVQTLANGDLYVQFAGTGYAWSNLTKRVGFSANATIHYEQDFQLDGSTMYIYFRPARTIAKKFSPLMVEMSVLPDTPLLPFIPGGTPHGFVNQIGEGMLDHQLSEGFTVVRESDGTASFALGTLEPGDKPSEPFEHPGGGRVLHTNERVEIHHGQRDYVGPITVPESGMAIFVTVMVDGAPQVDVQVHARSTSDPWLAEYISKGSATPPPAPAVLDEVATAVLAPAQIFRRAVKVPRGVYFVVLDNTATAGRSAPTGATYDDRAPLVGLAIEVGDAP